MKSNHVATDLTATGPSEGDSMTGAANSIRKNRKRRGTGSTGSTWWGLLAPPEPTPISFCQPGARLPRQLPPASGSESAPALSSTEAAKQKLGDFNKLLKIFDQNKDKRIGWDEILAVTGHDDPKMKREFQEAAGEDMKMDYKEFRKFMNKETGKKFFFKLLKKCR